ncbi:excalibur calcium-binding domain-containing protein [Lysinibacillus sp. NPDC047702]|uniref:excalibur calcium-binding domain-containing protein n=1 Tax=unclassified Lysinibacillus TaxID=2636778 RepID=UPI003CFDCD9E
MKKVILTLLTATLVFSFTSLNAEVEAKETFKNCKELNKKYPKGVKKGHAAYSANLDRDKDGWACEK